MPRKKVNIGQMLVESLTSENQAIYRRLVGFNYDIGTEAITLYLNEGFYRNLLGN